jgi:hypothetical protein
METYLVTMRDIENFRKFSNKKKAMSFARNVARDHNGASVYQQPTDERFGMFVDCIAAWNHEGKRVHL